MENLIRVGVDTSKSVFQLHGVDATEQPVLRRKLRRGQVLAPVLQLCGVTFGEHLRVYPNMTLSH